METKPKCGAKAKSTGKACQNPAGFKTDHPGEGRCHLHGGRNPIKSGRYSKVKSRRIADLIAEFEADADPLDLKPEVVLLRALIVDFVNRYQENTDALLAWHNSYGPAFEVAVTEWREEYGEWRQKVTDIYETGWRDVEPDDLPPPPAPPDPLEHANKPRQVLDILSAGKFVVQIGSLVERIEKQKQEGFVSLATLDAYLKNLGREVFDVAREVIQDDVSRALLLDTLEARWRVIPLRNPAPGAGAQGGSRAVN